MWLLLVLCAPLVATGQLLNLQADPALSVPEGVSISAVPITQTTSYDPQKVDWRNVISACHAATRFERRMANFCLRSAFHDAMSIDVACVANKQVDLHNVTDPNYDCGGADASMLLCTDEQMRDENGLKQHAFSKRTAALISSISAQYGCSMADALAVCAMTTVRVLGAEDLLKFVPLRVGRIDNAKCNPKNQLAADTATSVEAMDFFTARGLTIDDGTALLGVHALVPTKGCIQSYNGTTVVECDPMQRAPMPPRVETAQVPPGGGPGPNPGPGGPPVKPSPPPGGQQPPGGGGQQPPGGGGQQPPGGGQQPPGGGGGQQPPGGGGGQQPPGGGGGQQPGTLPMPKNGTCRNIHMFTFNNRWYLDVCSPTISIVDFQQVKPYSQYTDTEWTALRKKTACQYTSDAFRRAELTLLEKARSGALGANYPDRTDAGATWSNTGCPGPNAPGLETVDAKCPHPLTWFYPRNDAFIGLTCQEEITANTDDKVKDIKDAMMEYALNNTGWQHDFATSFTKMVGLGARWSKTAFYPTWQECQVWRAKGPGPVNCAPCKKLPVRTEPGDVGAPATYRCPPRCICVSSKDYGKDGVLEIDATME